VLGLYDENVSMLPGPRFSQSTGSICDMASEIPSSRQFHVAGFITGFLFQDGVMLPLMITTVPKDDS
jgi:hypothetical protein